MSTRIHSEDIGSAALAVRFFHLEKIGVARRAGLSAQLFESIGAEIAGVSLEEYRSLREALVQLRGRTVRSLLESPGVSSALAALPFQRGDVVVTFGDSITDDLVSWAHLLDEVIAQGRPDLGVRVINAGYTGDTTQEAISRFDTIVAMKPDWVIQLLGTNDARRHGASRVRTTTAEESARNLGVLSDLVKNETDARHVVLTPPPVLGRLADAWQPFQAEMITWHDADVADMAEGLRQSSASPLVDIHGLLSQRPWQEWLLPDGVHPSADGQSLITAAVISALADLGEPA